MDVSAICLLEEIIYIDSCIIEGYNLKSILQKEASFFLKESGADTIAICIKNEEHVELELLLEKELNFINLIKKYSISEKHIQFDRFINQCSYSSFKSQKYIEIDDLYVIFKGLLSKKEAYELENTMNFKQAIIFPMTNKVGQKIGIIIYFFSQNKQIIKDKLALVTHVLETLISPFYNIETHLLRVKCVQIDDEMRNLTEKEKIITHYILDGLQYQDIANELDISINTLKTHIKNIFNKYGVCSKIELLNKLSSNF